SVQSPPPTCTQLPCLRVMVLKNLENILCDLVHRLIAVDRDQPSGAPVILRYRGSLLLVGRQTGRNHFQPVVIAGHQPGPVNVANFIDTGRLEVDVVDPPTGRTRTASSNPEQQLIIVYVQSDHNWPRSSRARIVKERIIEQRIQPFGLSGGPRKPVQHVPALAVRLHQPEPDHFTNQVVGNQLASCHDGLGSYAELGALGHVVTQNVSGGDLWNPVPLHDALGLRALTCTRWTKQYHGTYVT